ncbi:MAG: hypothetical protein ACRENL_08435 [Candidatus Dormibacteria bacterium]
MSAEQVFAFICLLRDPAGARLLAERLESVSRPTAAQRPLFLVPGVRGLDFFASSASQPAVDRWWGRNVPPSAVPVYLLCHEDGLAAWLRGLDGIILVAAPESVAALYSSWMVVDADPAAALPALANAAISRFGTPSGPGEPSLAAIFQRSDSPLAGDDAPGPVAPAFGRPALPSLLRVEDSFATAQVGRDAAPLDPLELLAAESARREWQPPPPQPRRAQRGHGRAAGALSRVHWRVPPLLTRAGRPRTTEAALAALLVHRAPTLVVIGSRKGGVGKTSHAAGIAIAAGATLDSVGHRAAIVDANIANPDAWGHLNLPDRAATVRDVAAALSSGREPPQPVHAATPALACYPEQRDGVEYSRTDIRRLAAHLRARYAFVVVDMSNRLPDPTGGPEATVAAYWLDEADALVLPTATSRQDFNGVLDYLDVANLPPTVVPYIVSPARRNRRHPMTLQYLESITARVHSLVQIPDEADRVRFAGMEGAAVQDLSPRMRLAYRELTEAVARLPARARR